MDTRNSRRSGVGISASTQRVPAQLRVEPTIEVNIGEPFNQMRNVGGCNDFRDAHVGNPESPRRHMLIQPRELLNDAYIREPIGLCTGLPNNGVCNNCRCAYPIRPSMKGKSRLAVNPKLPLNMRRAIFKCIFFALLVIAPIGLGYKYFKMEEEIKDMQEQMLQMQRQVDVAMQLLQTHRQTNQSDNHPSPQSDDDTSYAGMKKKPDDSCNVNSTIEMECVSKNKHETILSNADADATGIPDFALESAGGRIVTIRNTEPHPVGEIRWGFLKLYGCQEFAPPEMMLRPSCLPGECWPFRGSEGSAVIKLLASVFISSVTLQHIPKTISPTLNIDSAPKQFSIVGLDNVDDLNGHVYGNFTYNMNGKTIQNFPVTKVSKRSYQYVEIFVHSNHGNKYHTCVYRLSVHGLMNPLE